MMEAAEAIVRTKHKTQTRWMADGWVVSVQKRCGPAVRAAAGAAVSFLLSFADLCGIPSGFHASWLAAVAAEGGSLRWPVAGCLAALIMRLIWGIDLRLPTLLSAAVIMALRHIIGRRSSLLLMLCTAASLLPQAAAAFAGGTHRSVLYALAAVLIGALAAPVMYRARSVIRSDRTISTVDEYLAVGYAAALLLCGGGRMHLPFVQLGALGAALMTLCAAAELGVGAGCMTGLVSGMVLAMQGTPVYWSVALAIAGFMAGTVSLYGRRGWTLVCFPVTGLTALYLADAMQTGLPGAVLLAALIIWLMPAVWMDKVRCTLRRFGRVASEQDGYAAALLNRWEQSMAALMQAMPEPEAPAASHAAEWWRLHLCDGCPDATTCTCMTTAGEAERADGVLAALLRGEGEQGMDGLRWLGCGRLYYMREGMYASSREHAHLVKEAERAAYDRDMLLTHLSAMAGAARRFAALSEPGWWDGMYAGRLRRAASELALPCRLLYARRAEGRICAAWHVEGGENLTDELCTLTSSVVKAPMVSVPGSEGIVVLAEKPVFEPDMAASAHGKLDDGDGNGDAVLARALPGGRYMIALSDGMGHGANAHRESVQTTAMLAHCLESGYTREQALTVVNGMMLSATHGERFATVDLVLADLWSGDVMLDKLGAANSYLWHDGELICLTGDSLPLGILESIESRVCACRMKDGDALVLMTDGVEESFCSPDALMTAIGASLKEETTQQAASMLLEAAQAASGGKPQDDQTVIVFRMRGKAAGAIDHWQPEKYACRPRRPFALQRIWKGV